MTTNIEAVYENGVFRPVNPVDLADKQKVTLTITNGSPADVWAEFASRDEWRKAIRSWAASHASTGSDADWSRESIYAGRGE